jgi:hypothetical protein
MFIIIFWVTFTLLSIWFIYEVLTAKEGYEDETGFYYGKQFNKDPD